MSWVLDTSVVVKWFLREEQSDVAQRYLDALTDDSAVVSVPSSMFCEFANVVWVRRRDGLTRQESAEILADLRKMPLEVVPVEEIVAGALDLAYEHEISPYDGVFVALAEERGQELVTADRTLWMKIHRVCPWVRML